MVLVRTIAIGLFIFLSSFSLFSQSTLEDSVVTATLVNVNLGINWPGADMAKRFGYNGTVGLGGYYKNEKNWLFGLQGEYIFGGKVKESDILSPLLTRQGNIISTNTKPAQVSLAERGYVIEGQVGHIFETLGPNKNSGLLTMGGIGFMQHKIHIKVNEDNVPQLQGDYIKGYDRLSNGLQYSILIGYWHLSNNKLINFYVGALFRHGLTRNRRTVNYDTRQKVRRLRHDILFGLKGGWLLPIYHEQTSKFYYN